MFYIKVRIILILEEYKISKKYFYILFIFVFINYLFGLNITINKGAIKKAPYAVLHITHDDYFMCISRKNEHKILLKFVCQLSDNIFVSNFTKNEYEFLDLQISKEEGKTYLNIYPKTKKSLMYSMKKYEDTNLSEDSTLKNKSKHWTFFFSNEENNLIFKKNENPKGLNFNIKLNKQKPFIGRLDEDKKPILIEDNEEITTLIKVKKLYEDKSYYQSLAEISILRQQQPDSIFKKEILLYSLRNYHGINNEEVSQDIVDTALQWLEENPSDADIPEVLFYLGVAYSRLYKQNESIQVFNELINNYDLGRFSFMAKLELGDNLKGSSNINESIRLYEDVLYNTKDLDIALLATQKIAEKSLDDGVLKRARYHYAKIIEKDIDFLVGDMEKGRALARRLISTNFKDLGLKLLDRILDTIDKRKLPEEHSDILFETAELYKDVDTDKAIVYYQEYIKLYPKGVFTPTAKEELDKLIFQSKQDKKLSDDEILINIEYLMKTYPKQPIAYRAFYKKMKIYLKRKRYTSILSKESEINALSEGVAPDKKDFLNEVKHGYAISLLNARECDIFVKVVEKYKVEINDSRDDDTYKCMYEQFRYIQARNIVDRQLANTKGVDKIIWAYRLTQLLIKGLDYKNMIPAIEDLLSMVQIYKIENEQYQETIYDLFFAYVIKKDEDIIMELARDIEKNFEDDIRNIRVFKKIINIAQARLDDKMILAYGNKMRVISKIHKTYPESPWIDYAIYHSYVNIRSYEKAFEVLENLYEIREKVKMSISKLKYMQSDIYAKMNKPEKEKERLMECSKIKNEKVWPEICTNAIKWLQ